MNNDKDLLSFMVDISIKADKAMVGLGKVMFISQSQDGLPPDMFMDEFEKRMGKLTKEQKMTVVMSFQSEMMKHKMLSGIGEGQKGEMQENNRKVLRRIMETGIFKF